MSRLSIAQSTEMLVVFVVLACAVGCGMGGGIDTGDGESETGAASGGDPEAAFLAAYRAAHEKKDVDALMALHCWDDVPADLRQTIRENMQDQVHSTVTEARIDPVAPGQVDERVEGTIRWRPNLPASGMFVATLEPEPGYSQTGIEAAVGQKGGRCLFVVMVPSN